MEISVGIQELFGSLSVGIFSIICIIYLVYYIFLKKDQNDFFSWIKEIEKHPIRPRGNLGILLVTILIIVFGHITQDITDHLTDSDSFLQNYYSLLETEKEHRFKTLVEKKFEDGKEIYALGGLGKELFRNRVLTQSKITDINDFLFTEDPEGYLKDIEINSESLTEPEKTEQEERLKSAKDLINRIYYQAKNWAYSQDNYYHLLRSIQTRIDFSRSLHLTSTFFLILFFIVWVLSYLRMVIKNETRQEKLDQASNNRSGFKKIWRNICCIFREKIPAILREQMSVAILILLFFSCFTLLGYKHAENMFNERAFGKYISHLERNSLQSNITNNTVWWVNYSLEYKALTRQIYTIATGKLDEALNDRTWTASTKQQKGSYINYMSLPPAIIMDIDETVLDNSLYQKQLIQSNSFYASSSWDKWIQKQQAKLVPGSKEFIESAQERGIKIFYITNRECNNGIREGQKKCPQENDTIQNLIREGIGNLTEDKILLKDEQEGWGKNKSSRREFLAKDYRILMLIGDDLQDFLSSEELKDLSDNDFFEEYKKYLGKKWFVLPNPIYGSWMKRIRTSDVKPCKNYL